MHANNPHSTKLPAPLPLSPVESYFWRFEEDLKAFRVAILFRLDGCIQADPLRIALQRLQQRHSKLQAAIVEDRYGRLHYEFSRNIPPVPFEIKDYDRPGFPWREETSRLLKVPLPAEGPLASVVVLRSLPHDCCQILLIVSHAIADGLSAIMLINDLLVAYSEAEDHMEASAVIPLPALSIRRAKPTGGWRGRYQLLRRFTRLRREERHLSQTQLPAGLDIPALSQWEHWIFSRADTLRLIRRCRKEQTSFSGALLAAVGCGLMDCLPVDESLFKWQLPFNVRESLHGPSGPVSGQDLGCFASNMNGFFKLQRPSRFWELARQSHGDMQAFIQQGGPGFGYNIASFFYNLTTEVRRLLKLPPRRFSPSDSVRVTLLATNYGVPVFRESYGSLRPRGCTLVFKNERVGPSLLMEALVMGQELNVGFTADGIDPEFWKRLQVAVRKHLESAAGGEAKPADSWAVGDRDQVDASPQRMRAAPHE